MRTLKKSLALVLALVMVLGLGVIGASADNALDNYTDASEIGDAYYEAVGVLTGLGIIDGMTETTIEPTGTYTREQAAKIIATMVLGVKNAESLTCVEAPFDDVPADRWSAGYIAFCVEQGIIDGMTDTTFEPTGTLTGFQWAKMLLAAVGFGANGEFTGTSWSLNTARVAHEAGLFTGDLSGADHVNLSRQQAALYAFNTLTEIKQVSYSANNDNYIYGLQGYDFVRDHVSGSWWADGTGFTLGESVFNLTNVEGQIIDNEGMGNKNTIIDVVGATDHATVNAETGLDLMFHAVRQWYIDNKTNDGVFTMDLAKVTTYTCRNIANGDDDAEDLNPKVEYKDMGKADGFVEYEAYLIDNSALDLDNGKDYTYNRLYANVGALTYRNTDKTTIDGTAADNDDILTDISEIKYNDTVVYYHVYSTQTNDDGEAWYAYPVSATSGVIKTVNQEKGKVISVTLTNDTVLPMSNLFGKLPNDTEKFIVGNEYSFVLDTHGGVISVNRNSARDLWAFTGDYQWSNEFGDHFSDYVVLAEFVNVATGEEGNFYVNFVDVDYKDVTEVRNDYFDISATSVDGLYLATKITSAQNVYADQYVIDDTATFNGKNDSCSVIIDGKADTVYYDPATVHFIIVSGKGSKLDVAHIDGVAALLEAYGAKSVTLNNYALVVSSNRTSEVATTVFAFDDTLSGLGDYVFVPYDVDRDEWTQVSGNPWEYVVSYGGVAYQNGKPVTVDYVTSTALKNTFLEQGFYTYKVDADGDFTLLEKVVNVTGGDCWYGQPTMTEAATYWILNGEKVNADIPVVDLRKGDDWKEITDVESLFEGYFDPNDNKCDPNVMVAYTLDSDGNVDCIYVMNAVDQWTLTMADNQADLQYTVSFPEGNTVPAYGTTAQRTVTVKLTATAPASFATVTSITFADGTTISGDALKHVDENANVTFDWVVDGNTALVIESWEQA